MDIGCYPIKTSRMVFDEEPRRVAATLVRDPVFDTDILTSAILEYPSGHCVFSCSTQVAPNQSMEFFGTAGRLEIEVPFNPRTPGTSRIRIDDGRDVFGSGITVEDFESCDQYTIQGDLFSQAVLNDTPVPTPLSDAVANMRAIDAIFESGKRGAWVTM